MAVFIWRLCAIKGSLAFLLGLLLAGCLSIPLPETRNRLADELANAQQWRRLPISAGEFELLSYVPSTAQKSNSLTIYIEGDGLAWITGTQASSDPTPRDPLALRLALSHRGGGVAYLGRACQFVGAEASKCASRYWTDARFAPEVIEASNRAVDILKIRFGATRITLIGYSGGGAVAALVAARRSDVDTLVTIAGNLDHQSWTTSQRIQPLSGSLNPVDRIDSLKRVQQWHFVGESDDNITPELVYTFANRFPESNRPTVIVKNGFDHVCCWVDAWPNLVPLFQGRTNFEREH